MRKGGRIESGDRRPCNILARPFTRLRNDCPL